MDRDCKEGRWWWALVLVPLSVMSNPWALLPTGSYYFRDFTLTFLPLRVFAARELREGRLPVWNPLIHDGTFQLPSLYPPDLLHVFSPSPVFVSWLLTLHLPLAALCMYWLVREIGGSRLAGLGGGVVYSLGGLALSSLNLYVFLQALALAPLVVGLLRRVARGGVGVLVVAAAVVAGALSTMAMEFVIQAVLLGCALAFASRASGRTVALLGVGLALGAGLAAVPLGLALGLLPETVRGAGFGQQVALSSALHPAVLLQCLVPNLFGSLTAPAEMWWGVRFFTGGFPYFLSIYVGPLALGLALVGVGRIERRCRWVLLAFGSGGLWYSLGAIGGLAGALRFLPGAGSFRYPVKAVLLPFMVVAILAGMGIDRLAYDEKAWKRLGCALGIVFAVALAAAGWIVWGGSPASWMGAGSKIWPFAVAAVKEDGLAALGVAAGSTLVLVLVVRGRLGLRTGCVALVGLLAADLGRAGAGMNPQVPAGYFERLPELAKVDEGVRNLGRVFSYGLDFSPAFAPIRLRGGRGIALTHFYVHRQILGPYSGVLDGVETSESADLTSFVPRNRELTPELYDPNRVGQLVPWFRNAAVDTVFSLDPLRDPALLLQASVEAGPPGVLIHVYRVRDPLPKASVVCRGVVVGSPEDGYAAPYESGFDPWRDVAIEGPGVGGCSSGVVTIERRTPTLERYGVDLDGPGLLVVRSSWARGWTASIDGHEAPVWRANGKHRAVGLEKGFHAVELRYHPPGLEIGIVIMIVAIGAALVLLRGTWR